MLHVASVPWYTSYMYAGVDIGGTKTLLAVLNEQAEIVEQVKFPTPQSYEEFLAALAKAAASLKHSEFSVGVVAVPGLLDRPTGVVLALGNLPWRKQPIQADCEAILHCPVVIENDAKLAGLSEAMLNKDSATVLYMTVSTGIGIAVVRDQRLDPHLLNSEGGQMILPHKDKLAKWESFASGKAIYEHFGKKAADIPADDSEAWGYVARNLATGLYELIAIIQPDLIVIGGSIGTYFDRYNAALEQELGRYNNPLVPIPRIVAAQRPELAVVYGCYDMAKQAFPHATAAA